MNVKMLRVISILNELAEKEENGILKFEEANKSNEDFFIFYNTETCTRREDGALLYRVVKQKFIIDDPAIAHHDIISYYGDDADDDYSVMVVDDGESELCLEVYFPDEEGCIEFCNGKWFFEP